MVNETADYRDDDEEYSPLRVPEEYRRLETNEIPVTIYELSRRYVSQEIVLEPDFQRHYVWDRTRASRFIESLLLGLPSPPIFVSEEKNGHWTVIDGHQRLETIFRYMQPRLPSLAEGHGVPSGRFSVGSTLRLRELEVMSDLNGQDITSLSHYAFSQFLDTILTFIVLPKTAHPDMKYVLFARLNLGSMTLNNQELRNCIYRGSYNKFIQRIAEGPQFLNLWNKNSPDKRMRDRERLLRFFALLHRRGQYRTPFRAFLNDEMEEFRHVERHEEEKFVAEFNLATKWLERVFEKDVFFPFRIGDADNPPGRWVRRRLDTLYEVEMVGFAEFGGSLDRIWSNFDIDQRDLFQVTLRRRFVDVMTDSRFLLTLSEGTTRPEVLRTRFGMWNQAIETVLRDPGFAMDEFSEVLSKLRESSICAACPQQMTPDDAVWSQRPGTRFLAHRYCAQAS